MYERLLLKPLENERSFFLFGAHGTGKSHWLKTQITGKDFILFNLLKPETRMELSFKPNTLEKQIPANFQGWVILDEIQKAPTLLDIVHKLIEEKGYKFILTSSSTRKLKRLGVNILAGHAQTYYIYPLSSTELKEDFNIQDALKKGMLPSVYRIEGRAQERTSSEKYFDSYTQYLYEEIIQESLSHNLEAFSRFLAVASFSQASSLDISDIAKETGINERIVSSYFDLLEDLLLSYRLNVFSRKAKRRLINLPKFYFFDVGIFQRFRNIGVSQQCRLGKSAKKIEEQALETLVLQELLALNAYYELGYRLYYWKTTNGHEIDFILYGKEDLIAIEVTRSSSISSPDTRSLKLFLKDYPNAKAYIVYGGEKKLHFETATGSGIECLPVEEFFRVCGEILGHCSQTPISAFSSSS